MESQCEKTYHPVVKNPGLQQKTYHGRLSAPMKPERQNEVSFYHPNVHATFYNSGLLKVNLYSSEGRARSFQLTNTRPLYKTGHVEKFLAMIQAITESYEINFHNFRNFSSEFNDSVSGLMFRTVLDYPDLPIEKKFAAIMATLITSPALNAGEVIEIAQYQKSPITDTNKLFIASVSDFLYPHFNPYEPRGFHRTETLNLTNESTRKLYSLIGFFGSDDENKTLFEFMHDSSESTIKLAMGTRMELCKAAQLVYNEWGYQRIQDLQLFKAKRLANIPTDGASGELKELTLNRIRNGSIMMAEEIQENNEDFSDLAPFFTRSEYEDFYRRLSESSYSEVFPKSLIGNLAVEVIVNYYLRGGFEKVKELLDLLFSPSLVSRNNFWHTKTFLELTSPVVYKMKAEHFKRLLNDEDYNEMPLGWALPLLIAAIEVEKQEKEEALLASGKVPLAA